MSGQRTQWWGHAAVAFAAIAAWSAATPLLAGPDEAQHAIRAAAEVRGTMGDVEWVGLGPVAHARAPEAYAVAGELACASFDDQPRDCGPPFEGGHPLVDVTTYEFRPPPPYYWLVGLPTLVAPAAAGVWAMRLLSAALSAAFLASALASAARAARPRLARTAVLVAATPMTLYLGGQVNPNGVEVAAAACAWASAFAVAAGPAEPTRRLVARTGVALGALALLRGFSPAYAGLIAVAAAVAASPARRCAVVARADVRAAGAAVALAMAGSLAWTASVYDDSRIPRDGNGLASVPERTAGFLHEAVGVFGSLDQPTPAAVVATWALASTIVVVLSRPGWLVAALATIALAVPASVDGLDVPSIGFDWQGRYSLPLYAGVVIAAAMTAKAPESARWRGVAVAALAAGHAGAFAAFVVAL